MTGPGDDTLYGDEGDDFYGGDDGLVAYTNCYAGGGEYLPAFAAFAVFNGDGIGGGFGGGVSSTFLTNNDTLDGGAGDDEIDGGSGDDRLLGGEGADHLVGGADGFLNTSNDDYLDGGIGLDTMEGGTGNDTYVVDGTYVKVADANPPLDDCGDTVPDERLQWTTDTVFEYAGEGYDIVMSSASYTLTGNVEELRLIFDPASATTNPLRFMPILLRSVKMVS